MQSLTVLQLGINERISTHSNYPISIQLIRFNKSLGNSLIDRETKTQERGVKHNEVQLYE